MGKRLPRGHLFALYFSVFDVVVDSIQSVAGAKSSLVVQEDPPSRFLGVDISTLAAELGRLPEKP